MPKAPPRGQLDTPITQHPTQSHSPPYPHYKFKPIHTRTTPTYKHTDNIMNSPHSIAAQPWPNNDQTNSGAAHLLTDTNSDEPGRHKNKVRKIEHFKRTKVVEPGLGRLLSMATGLER